MPLRTPAEESLLARVRTATRHRHDALEALPVSLQLRDGSLALTDWQVQLDSWAAIYRALEPRIAASSHPTVAAIRAIRRDRRPLVDPGTDPDRAPRVITATCARLADPDRVSDAELIGWIYLTEGSTLGATHIRRMLVACFGPGAPGVALHDVYGDRTGSTWRRVVGCLSAPMHPAEVDAAVRGAVHGFDALIAAWTHLGRLTCATRDAGLTSIPMARAGA